LTSSGYNSKLVFEAFNRDNWDPKDFTVKGASPTITECGKR